MALTIELSAAIATTRTSWTLTDSTTYGTGGNPARSAVGVFAQSYKMNFDNTVAETLTTTGDDADPETDSSWVITYTDDGWYKTYFVIIPDYDVATTYARYDAVFNPSDNKVYRSLQSANTGNAVTNTTWWEEITGTGIAGLANNKDTSTESANITSTIYQRVFSANGQYDYGNQLSAQCECTDCDETETLQWYNLYAMLLDEMAICDSRSEVLKGEKIARRIESEFLAD